MIYLYEVHLNVVLSFPSYSFRLPLSNSFIKILCAFFISCIQARWPPHCDLPEFNTSSPKGGVWQSTWHIGDWPIVPDGRLMTVEQWVEWELARETNTLQKPTIIASTYALVFDLFKIILDWQQLLLYNCEGGIIVWKDFMVQFF